MLGHSHESDGSIPGSSVTRRHCSQNGFTLVELSVVILIMGLILGGLAMPLATQRDNARFQDGHKQLETIETAVKGYALVNGSLPCPATPASNGNSSTAGSVCTVQHGFVPATTLNIDGPRNGDSLLLDPWGSPYRYSVSNSDVDSDGQWDFTAPGELSDVTIALLMPDLAVCSTAIGASATACATAAATLANRSPLIIYSLGKDWASFSSPDQLENVGTTIAGGPSGASYQIASNAVFVSHGRSNQPGGEFDDVVVWMSANTLYHSLVLAGQLP